MTDNLKEFKGIMLGIVLGLAMLAVIIWGACKWL
jgi:hypothetical protein